MDSLAPAPVSHATHASTERDSSAPRALGPRGSLSCYVRALIAGRYPKVLEAKNWERLEGVLHALFGSELFEADGRDFGDDSFDAVMDDAATILGATASLCVTLANSSPGERARTLRALRRTLDR